MATSNVLAFPARMDAPGKIDMAVMFSLDAGGATYSIVGLGLEDKNTDILIELLEGVAFNLRKKAQIYY